MIKNIMINCVPDKTSMMDNRMNVIKVLKRVFTD
jgi:hypothetical protein